MQVQLADQYGNAEPAGITVSFTAPLSGASGTFAGGGATVNVTTNASGVATAPAFTANTVAGGYTVTASTAGVSPNASFSLTGVAPGELTSLAFTPFGEAGTAVSPDGTLNIVLGNMVIPEPILGKVAAASLASTADVGYTRDREEAVRLVRSGEFQMAFLLGHPSADEVRSVAAAGDKMPPKSTFFAPKPRTGLVMHSLEGRRTLP